MASHPIHPLDQSLTNKTYSFDKSSKIKPTIGNVLSVWRIYEVLKAV